MRETLREHIQALAGDADASGVIADWDEYFKEYRIPWHRQQDVFNSVVRDRLLAGAVSIAAPTEAEKAIRGDDA